MLENSPEGAELSPNLNSLQVEPTAMLLPGDACQDTWQHVSARKDEVPRHENPLWAETQVCPGPLLPVRTWHPLAQQVLPSPAGASWPAPTWEGSCSQVPSSSSSSSQAVCSKSLLTVSTGIPCLQIQGKQATTFLPGLQGITEIVQKSQISNLQPRAGVIQDAPHSTSFDGRSHLI